LQTRCGLPSEGFVTSTHARCSSHCLTICERPPQACALWTSVSTGMFGPPVKGYAHGHRSGQESRIRASLPTSRLSFVWIIAGDLPLPSLQHLRTSRMTTSNACQQLSGMPPEPRRFSLQLISIRLGIAIVVPLHS